MKMISMATAIAISACSLAQIKVNSITATYNGGTTWPTSTITVSQSTRGLCQYQFSAPVIGSNPEAQLDYSAIVYGSKGQSITNWATSADADLVQLTYTVEYTGVGVPNSVGSTAAYSLGRYTRVTRYIHFNIAVAGASASVNVDTNVTYLGSTSAYPGLGALAQSSGGGTFDFDEYYPGISSWNTAVDPITGTTSGFHLDPDGKYRATFTTGVTLNSTDMDCSSLITVNGASGGGVSVTAFAAVIWRLRLDSFAGYTP